MENCIYHGNAICTYDLKDNNGLYYEDMVLEWKLAASERQLTCMECGAKVYLAAGPIKEPYFAHYDLQDCDYGNGHESEELKKGKRLLYQLIKRSFPNAFIQARYRMENGMYATLYCLNENGQALAFDYRLQNNSLQNFRIRDTFYQANHITPVYVRGIRQEKDTKQIDWYQSLIQTSMDYLAFLNTDTEKLTLKKSFSYRLGKDRKFKYLTKSYSIKELLINQEGRMICDFSIGCEIIEQQIKEEKLSYQKRQNQLQELREQNQRLEEQEAERLEAYRRLKEQEEKAKLGAFQEVIEPAENEHSEVNHINNEPSIELNPILLEKCKKMIESGNAHLVSKKYYDAIMGMQ